MNRAFLTEAGTFIKKGVELFLNSSKEAHDLTKSGEVLANTISGTSELKATVGNIEHVINIPKGVFKAPIEGFNESTQAYVDIIKNNTQELRVLTSKYFTNYNEAKFLEEFSLFLKEKMKLPYFPELKKVVSNEIAGGMQNTSGVLYYNSSEMTRLSELMSTEMHELHHFLQQKEIFATVGIENFSRMKAKADIIDLATRYPNRYKNLAEIQKAIAEQTKGYIEDYKSAGWEEMIQHYPKNTNPNSQCYKRAMELKNADLEYGEKALYFKNKLEKEAYDISVHTQLEIEHSVLNQITFAEKNSALEIYNILTSPEFEGVERAEESANAFKTNPFNIIEIIREAGTTNAYKIIELIW